jgi:hypothetical protein
VPLPSSIQSHGHGLNPSLLNLLQSNNNIVDRLHGVDELAEVQFGDGTGRVENYARACRIRVFGGRKEAEFAMSNLEMIDDFPPGSVATVHDVSPLNCTWVAWQIQSKNVSLGNVTNIGNKVRRESGCGATHYGMDHAVHVESFFGNGTGVGLCIWAKDETRQNCEIFRFPYKFETLGPTCNNIKLRVLLHEIPECSLRQELGGEIDVRGVLRGIYFFRFFQSDVTPGCSVGIITAVRARLWM